MKTSKIGFRNIEIFEKMQEMYLNHLQSDFQTNIIVILAWFGVNLLSIGLHSYGFVSGIAVNIVLFSAFEIITGIGTYYWARSKSKKVRIGI